jgi:predicted DNA-binding protein (MmcQ/YjbR family)
MLDENQLRAAFLSLPAAEETFPFGDAVRVFKVMGKMFGLQPVDEGQSISLKCDPMLAEVLRGSYPNHVTPGYHLSKRHWNTVLVDGAIADDEVLGWIQDSYDLVVKGLKKADREQLAAMK